MTARQLKNLRRRLGWSQGQLAEELRLHPMTISKWERGVVEIPYLGELALKYIADRVAA